MLKGQIKSEIGDIQKEFNKKGGLAARYRIRKEYN